MPNGNRPDAVTAPQVPGPVLAKLFVDLGNETVVGHDTADLKRISSWITPCSVFLGRRKGFVREKSTTGRFLTLKVERARQSSSFLLINMVDRQTATYFREENRPFPHRIPSIAC